MAEKAVHYKLEESKDRQGVASYLRELADKLEANQVVLRQAMGDEVTLDIPNAVDLVVEADEKNKGDKIKHSLEIDIKWMEQAPVVTEPAASEETVA